MLGVAISVVFLVTLALSWMLFKVIPLLQKYQKWHAVLDDKYPHDPIHPLWGNVHQIKSFQQFIENNLKFIVDGAKSYIFWIGFSRPVIAVAHPDTIKRILRTTEPKAEGGGGYNFLKSWLGDGLLISKGKKWERNRRLLTPAFHFDILQPYVKIYNQSAEGFMRNIANGCKGGNSVEVFAPAGLATLDTMLQCTLSYNDDIQEKGWTFPNQIKLIIVL